MQDSLQANSAAKTARGIGKLLEHHMVDHIIASHLGVNPKLNEQFAEGTLRYTLVPQGTSSGKDQSGSLRSRRRFDSDRCWYADGNRAR